MTLKEKGLIMTISLVFGLSFNILGQNKDLGITYDENRKVVEIPINTYRLMVAQKKNLDLLVDTLSSVNKIQEKKIYNDSLSMASCNVELKQKDTTIYEVKKEYKSLKEKFDKLNKNLQIFRYLLVAVIGYEIGRNLK